MARQFHTGDFAFNARPVPEVNRPGEGLVPGLCVGTQLTVTAAIKSRGQWRYQTTHGGRTYWFDESNLMTALEIGT
jgi:hypothetical protein